MPRARKQAPSCDDWFPMSAAEHRRQLGALRRLLGKRARRVLDLGSGDGRLARPLADSGHDVLAIDRDEAALRRCSDAGISTGCMDFLDSSKKSEQGWEAVALIGPYDAVLCLGHTFMLAWKPAQAVTLLRRVRSVLKPGGVFVIDDFCAPLWREVASGNWQNGVSPNGNMQLVWDEGDNVLALRSGGEVRRSDWRVGRSDRRLRLWSAGELELLSLAAGWSAPRRSSGLCVWR